MHDSRQRQICYEFLMREGGPAPEQQDVEVVGDSEEESEKVVVSAAVLKD